MTTDMLSLNALLRLARDTVTNPQEGASTVLSFAPPMRALWLMFALVVVLSLFLGEVVFLVSGPLEEGPLTGAYSSPLALGLIQAATLLVTVHAMHRIGVWFGGTGRFEEAFILIIWLQFILLCAQVVQLAAMILLPPLAMIILLLSIGLMLWLFVNFVAVLHGFTSLGMVFFMTLASAFAIVFLMSLVLAILGIGTQTGAAI